MEPLVEIDFDSGTRYYSRTGMRAPHAYYEGLIASFGSIQREISLDPGQYRAAQIRIDFSNASGEFSRLRDSESWRNRLIRVRLGNPEIGFNDFEVAFVGRVTYWSLEKGTVSIDAVDSIQSRFDRPLGFVIDSGFFHRLPDETPRELAPLLIGAVDSPGGALPAYLVEPSIEITPYRYLACQGIAKSIDEVYTYGALVDPGDYTITYGLGPDGLDVTFIDFDVEQKDPSDQAEPHVSWNGSGVTDDGTIGGNAIVNGAEQLYTFLVRNGGVKASEIDIGTVNAAVDALNQKQIQGGFAVTDRSLTVGNVVQQFAESYSIQVFMTNEGKVGMTAPDPVVDENGIFPEIDAISDVVLGSFQVEGPNNVASSLLADSEFNWFTGNYLRQTSFVNPQQIAALGESVPFSSAHPFIRDSIAMSVIADIRMFFLREQRQLVSVRVAPRWYRELEIGDVVRLSHFAGPGQAGYVRRVFRVIGMGLTEVGGGSIAAMLQLVDLDAEPFFSVPLMDFSALPLSYSDYHRNAPIARGNLRLINTAV